MKTFFQDFPKTTTTIDGIPHLITDITTAYQLITNKDEHIFFYQKYFVADGETPETISQKIYNNPAYYWTILIVNNIINPYIDWVKSGQVFLNWINEKYTDEDGLNGIHHFWNVDEDSLCDDYDDKAYRLIIGSLPSHIRPVTNQEYEVEENNKKREINIISTKYIAQFANNFSKMLANKLNN